MRLVRFCATAALVAALIAVGVGTADAGPISWTNWTSATAGASGSASGTLPGITVSYSGEIYFAQTAPGGTYYYTGSSYTSATISNAPPDSDIIAIVGNTALKTITFSSPVTNPVMAIVSLGQPGYLVNYTFGQPFDVLSFGAGYWGGGTLTELPGNVLQGNEGHGAIQFLGTFSSISWTVNPAETWHGFTVGIPAQTSAVPEPATLALVGVGLALAAARARRRKTL